MAKSHFSGPTVETGVVNSKQAARFAVRSSSIFIPAKAADLVTGTWTETWGVAGDISIQRTGAVATAHLSIPISIPTVSDAADAQRNEKARGPRILTLTPVYRLLTANMTSITPTLETTVFTAGAGIAITDRPITGAMSNVFHATNINKPVLTVTTPFVLDNTMYCTLDIVLVDPGTSVFQLHGCHVNYDELY